MMRRMGPFAVAVLLQAAASGEVFGNFHTLGVVVDCPRGRSPDEIGRVRVYLVEDGEKRPVHDAVRVASLDYFASSIFWLQPGTRYEVAVEFYDRADKLVAQERHTGTTRPEVTVPPPARSIYVSPAGNDAASGGPQAPLRTVAAALAKATPGTAVVLRKGVYYEGGLTTARNGEAGAPIVITAAPGEEAILDGSDPALLGAGWKPLGGNVYARPFKGKTWNVSLEETSTGKLIRACPVPSADDLIRRKSGGKSFEKIGVDAAYSCDGQTVSVLLPGPDISRYTVHVAAQTRAFVLEHRHHVSFDGLTFRHYGRGYYGAGMFVGDSNDILVQRCRFVHCNTGVWVKGASDRLLIQDSEFHDDLDRWSFGYVKSRQGDIEYHGQVETGAVYIDGKYFGRGLVFRHNLIDGLFDGAHIAMDSRAPIPVKTHETDFYRNRILATCDDLIEVDGHARNVRVFENRMENCLSGVSIAQALDGPTWVVRNAICRAGESTGRTMDGYEGYPVKTNGGLDPQIGSGHVFFYHNTSWTPDPGARAFLVKHARWKRLTFRNNIWCGKQMGFQSWQSDLSPVDMSSDVVYTEKGPLIRLGRQTPTPGDQGNGVVLDCLPFNPQLASPDAGDYRLAPASPCIDRGVVVPGINDGRFDGAAPDIGWCERGRAVPLVGPRRKLAPTPVALKTTAPAAPARGFGGLADARAAFARGEFRKAAAMAEDAKALAGFCLAFSSPERLRGHIIEHVRSGARPRVPVAVMGVSLRGELVSADEDGLKASALGQEFEMRWEELSAKTFGRVARAAAKGDGAALLDAAMFYAVLGENERADDLMRAAAAEGVSLTQEMKALIRLFAAQ